MSVFGNRLKYPAIRWWVRAVVVVLAVVVLGQESSATETRHVSAHVTYRVQEGVYVNAGSREGLAKGMKGQMLLEGGQSLVFEVIQSAESSSLLRLDGRGSALVGTLDMPPVQLVFEADNSETADSAMKPQTTGRGSAKDAEPFVPLLTPSKQPVSVTQSKNISHGRLGVRQSLLTGTDNGQDRMVTRLYTSGNIDRLFGSRWSLNWSANARYRTGDGYVGHPEYETIQPLIYSAMLQHPLGEGGFVRLGRFLPFELPGVGYLDGAQIETTKGGPWRFGAMAGLKPDRINLDLTADEPTVVGYATLEAGSHEKNYYSGTAGLLGSLYQGRANRLALLFDQRVSLGRRFDLFSTAEFDFGIADTTNSATQLSRFDLNASYKLHRNHTLRAGVDHWERADTPVERDLFNIVDDSVFNDGYWRYWVGAQHRLPWNLRLNEEIAYTTSAATSDAVRWRVGLTRTGIFGWDTASVAATVYNLEAMGSSGAGWLLSAYLPLFDGKLSVRPVASMRWLDPSNGGDGLSVSYYAVYLDARFSRTWLLTGGFTQTLGDGADSMLFDLGLRYSW